MHENQLICITIDLYFTLEVELPAGVSKKVKPNSETGLNLYIRKFIGVSVISTINKDQMEYMNAQKFEW